MYYRRTAGGWEGGSIKRVLGRGCMYYPHSPPNNLVINITGMGMILYI